MAGVPTRTIAGRKAALALFAAAGALLAWSCGEQMRRLA